ncbi:MAG: toll/interleukin-1 receptor domain-containing protein [Promethearchaeota archaeon]|jgi:hypothetical protein
MILAPSWKREYDDKSLIHLEELILSSTKIPNDPDRFFRYFSKKIESKEITLKGISLEISEIGPHSDFSTKFQLLNFSQVEFEFSVRFEVVSEKTNIYFYIRITTMREKMGLYTKSVFKEYDKILSTKLIQIIKVLTIKSIDYTNSAPEPFTKSSDMSQSTKDEGISVFVSYATKDAPSFRIEELAEELTKTEEIDNVLYWQEDNKDNIIEYMNDNLGKCEVVLLFCSPNSLISVPVKKEWMAAEGLNKPIIPIFLSTEHIPPLLNNREGLQFDPFNFEKNIEKLYKLIVKKSILIQ